MALHVLARTAGLFYAANIAIGAAAAMAASGGHAARADMLTLLAALDYAVVSLLLAKLFEPAGRSLSWGAAIVSLAGCALSAAGALHLSAPPVNPLAFFGLYCLLLGLLVARSRIVPVVLGASLAIGGLGWLTFAVPQISSAMMPWSMLPGVLGETLFTLWLLVFGTRAQSPGATAYASSPA